MGLKKEIAKYKTESVCVQIFRKSKMPNIHGYILDYSDDYVMIQEVDDFNASGYIIMPKKSIKSIRFNQHDEVYDEIIKAEKQFEKIILKYDIDLTNWETIFKSIKLTGLNLSIECKKVNFLVIGILGNVKNDTVYIRDFDTAGVLDDIETPIFYKKISRVNFDDNYINVFSKYLKTAN